MRRRSKACCGNRLGSGRHWIRPGRKRFGLRGGASFKHIRESTPGIAALGAGGRSPPPSPAPFGAGGQSPHPRFSASGPEGRAGRHVRLLLFFFFKKARPQQPEQRS